jgi:hypothetical protein
VVGAATRLSIDDRPNDYALRQLASRRLRRWPPARPRWRQSGPQLRAQIVANSDPGSSTDLGSAVTRVLMPQTRTPARGPLPRMEPGPPSAQMIALDDPAKFVLSFSNP